MSFLPSFIRPRGKATMSLFPAFINPGGGATALPPPPTAEILSLLGYQRHQLTNALITGIRTDLYQFEIDRVAAIREELAEIDAQIKEALADSAVTQTCKTSMNWGAHVRSLKQQAHSLLLEIGRIYDLPVAYSKYSSAQPYVTQYQ
jgi:hypothetical protein